MLRLVTAATIAAATALAGLAATANNGVTSSVSLSWAAKAGTSSYNVYRSVVQGGPERVRAVSVLRAYATP